MNERFVCWRSKNILIPILFLLGGVWWWPQSAVAADLRVVTDRSTYQVGDTVVANVILSSASQSANAVSGTLGFSPDYLQVSSLSKIGSIINLWVQEPAFSNTGGNVSFEGAILNPGFTGGSGRVVSINFRARKAGTAILSFSTGSILANDGAGTSILKTLGKTSFTIQEAKAKTDAEPVISPPATAPNKPVKPVATSTPVTPTPAVIEPPELEINELKTTHSNRTSFIIVGASRTSVIDRYEIQLDDGSTLILPGRNSPTYHTPALEQGDHLIIVTAIDLAGQRTERQLTFTISSPLTSRTLFRWGNSLIALMSILVPLAILLAILILVFSSTKRNIIGLKRRLRQEVAEAEAGLHQAFDLIRDDLQKQVRRLDQAKTKRKLSTAETKLLKTLKSDLAQAEKFITKEIDDIGKQVK